MILDHNGDPFVTPKPNGNANGANGHTSIGDSLINFVTGLGTSKDPTRAAIWRPFNALDRNVLENMYRGDWMARRIIDAPAKDATREWRQWQASQPQIEALEACEKRHKLQLKLKQALIRARLYGGAALVLGVDQGETYEPLDIDKIGKDDLKFIVVMNRFELAAGPRIYDAESPWYTQPEYYTVSTPYFGFNFEADKVNLPLYGPSPVPGPLSTPHMGLIKLHPSRVIAFSGADPPDWRLTPLGGPWGDSILQQIDDTLRDFNVITGTIAAMVSDAKVDVVQIPDFSKKIATSEYAQRLLTRFTLANMAKSTSNALIVDKEELWQRIQTQFGGIPELIREFLTVVAGAANIPVSKFVGQSPGKGLSSQTGGETDLQNYYDDVASDQKTIYGPQLEPLDQIMIRSVLGKPDPSIHHIWAPLWQMDEKEKAEIASKKAATTQVYVNLGLLNEDALRRATVNQLIEDGVYPGLEDAIDEFGEEPLIPEGAFDPMTGQPLDPSYAQGGGYQYQQDARLQDARPRTLYVRRDVVNADEIIAWAKEQGFPTTVSAEDMHVTIAFSRMAVDWMKAREVYDDQIIVPPSGVRMIEALGDGGAIALLFNSSALAWRHEQIAKDTGATWDWPEYQPHITITWGAGDFIWQRVEPYRGRIVLGPEVFEEVKENWQSTIKEEAGHTDA